MMLAEKELGQELGVLAPAVPPTRGGTLEDPITLPGAQFSSL